MQSQKIHQSHVDNTKFINKKSKIKFIISKIIIAYDNCLSSLKHFWLYLYVTPGGELMILTNHKCSEKINSNSLNLCILSQIFMQNFEIYHFSFFLQKGI